MITRWIIALAAGAALGGCATYSDLVNRPADYSATTNKSPQAYVECVLPKWLDTNATAHIVNDGEVRILVLPAGGSATAQVLASLSAKPVGGGSLVEMKHMPSLGKFTAQWMQAKACL